MLNYEKFKKEVCDRVLEEFPENIRQNLKTDVQEVVKNNNQKYDGLIIKDVGKGTPQLSRVINLQQEYGAYCQDNGNIERSLKRIVKMSQAEPEADIKGMDFDSLLNFDTVKDKIRAKVLNLELNSEYLEDKAFKQIEDLAVTYYIFISANDKEIGGIPITSQLMEKYGLTIDQLHELALQNGRTYDRVMITSMEDMAINLMSGGEKFDGGIDLSEGRPTLPENQIYILTYKTQNYGAAACIDESVLEKIGNEIGDFYILPSSIYEVMVVPMELSDMNSTELREMVYDVNHNSGTVEPEEILSDNVYKYDVLEKKFEMVRDQEMEFPEPETTTISRQEKSMDM